MAESSQLAKYAETPAFNDQQSAEQRFREQSFEHMSPFSQSSKAPGPDLSAMPANLKLVQDVVLQGLHINETEYGKSRIKYEKVENENSSTLFKINLSSPLELVNASADPKKSSLKNELCLSKFEAENKVSAVGGAAANTGIEQAAAQIIKTAENRFGKAEIEQMKIARADLGTAVSALLLGPGLCKAMGPEEARNFGKRLIVFAVAPLLGMSEEADKQFRSNTMKTINEGSGNMLVGTGIGALLERANPLILSTLLVGSSGIFIHEQFAGQQNQKRNRELAEVSNKIDSASSDELIDLAKQTKSMLGPELYKGAFVLATGGIGIPKGQTIAAGVKEELKHTSGKLDMKEILAGMGKLKEEVWQTISNMLSPQGRQLAAEGHPGVFMHSAAGRLGPEDQILQMQGRAGGRAFETVQKWSSSIKNEFEQLLNKPLCEKFDLAAQLNSKLLDKGKAAITSKAEKEALTKAENEFAGHMRTMQQDFEAEKAVAKTIEAKPLAQQTKAEQERLERFYAMEDRHYEIMTSRLKERYGWDGRSSGMLDTTIEMQAGFGTQRRVCNQLSRVLNEGLENNQLVSRILKEKGKDPERAKGWLGIPMRSGSAADHAGCDYLLVNKETGEMYAIDMTERTMGLRNSRTADTKLTNRSLEFPGKNVPAERLNTVIGVADELTMENLAFRQMMNKKGLSRTEAENLVGMQEREELAEIIARTISEPSPLNVFNAALPAAGSAAPSRLVFDLARFQHGLEEIGFRNWARAVQKSIDYLKKQNPKERFF